MHHAEDDNIKQIETLAANFEGKWIRANDPTKTYTIKGNLVVLRNETIKIAYHNCTELSLLLETSLTSSIRKQQSRRELPHHERRKDQEEYPQSYERNSQHHTTT